jgi:hypothetical protein
LLAPVAGLLGASLAVGFVALGRWRSFRWTAGLLIVLTAAIAWTLASSWRRVANPYEGMFATAGSNFARDLPDGPRGRGEAQASHERGREAARAAVLLSAMVFWAAVFARPRTSTRDSPRAAWREVVAFHAAAWSTLGFASVLLMALRR